MLTHIQPRIGASRSPVNAKKSPSLQLPTVINEQRGCRTTTRRAQFAQLRFSPLASWRKLPVDQIERAPASPDPIVLRRRHASLPLAQPPKAQQPCLSTFAIPDLGFSCATVVGQLQLLRPSFCLRIVWCGVCEWAMAVTVAKAHVTLHSRCGWGCGSISLAMSLMASQSMRVFCDN